MNCEFFCEMKAKIMRFLLVALASFLGGLLVAATAHAAPVGCGSVVVSRNIEVGGVFTATYHPGGFTPETISFVIEGIDGKVVVARERKVSATEPTRLVRLDTEELDMPIGAYRFRTTASVAAVSSPCEPETAYFSVGGVKIGDGLYVILAEPLVKQDGLMNFKVMSNGPVTARFFQTMGDTTRWYEAVPLAIKPPVGFGLPSASWQLPNDVRLGLPIYVQIRQSTGGESATFLLWDASRPDINVFWSGGVN